MNSLLKKLINTKQNGFTFVEIVIIAPIVILTIGAFIAVIVNMTGDVLVSRGQTVLAYNLQDALNRMEDDVKLSTTFLGENNIAITSPQGFDDSTGVFDNVGSNGTMLVLNTLATTGNPLASTSSVAYLSNSPNACGTLQGQNTPMTLNVIYYVKAGTLWRRTVAPSNYATAACNNTGTGTAAPWQQPSCSPGYSGTFCKTQDIRLVDGVGTTGFSVQYYNSASSTSANATAIDTTVGLSGRNAALASVTTIGVSLDATQTIAGKTIEQTGTMRVTRLDTNASAIAAAITPTTPSTPTVTGTYSTPATATFTWPTSTGGGTVTYTLDYSTNGGTSWTNGLTNSTLTSYTVPGTIQNQTVQVRVKATNTAGTSSYGTATVTIPLWATPVLQNGWTDYISGYVTAAYTKTSSGLVVLKGLIKSGTATSGTVITTLPVGYRPAERLIFISSTGGVAGRVDVDTDGTVSVQAGSNSWLALDDVRFMPAGNSFTSLTPLLNGWTIFGGAPWSPPGYMIDPSGRVQLKGVVANGSVGIMASLPTAAAPTQSSYVAESAANTFGEMSIQGNLAISPADLYYVGGGNSFFTLQTMYYPSTYTNWSNLSLLNGWAYYGSPFTTPQYTKGSDGVVTVKGFVKSGAAGTVIGTLPAGYRPSQQIIFATPATDAYARIDVAQNGNIIAQSFSSSTWLSIDNINFVAEQ